ncbi:glycoside hydrolase family protein [Venturia nashicola]|uniref:Probable beta-glucosidase btgE n=1 Tax=Venturia nashicola TaxID=86259 RepID=A0A4Z1NNM6_9PEZI|nr:glycoside hydrolase family 17 protein [Venturia nashicola]TLD26107.1 glycoside hydrolase family protein [Venturia nashicola]
MKAGLIAIAAGSLVGSVAALHEHHAKRAEYGYDYDMPAISSSTPASAIKPSTSSATKPSTSPAPYYDYPVSPSSSSASASNSLSIPAKPVALSESKSSSNVPSYTTSSTLTAPVKPAETCLATSTKTVTVYVDDYTTPVKAVVPPTSSTYSTETPIIVAPTPVVTIFKTPGTYALPTVTLHLNKTITVVAKKTANLTPGPNTFGGYTTTVNESSTITCPYVATETNNGKVTEVVSYTTTFCPSAGVYTPITPTVTVHSTKTIVVYAVPTTYTPGDYTVPAATYTATAYDEVYVCPYEPVTTTKVTTMTAKYTTSAVTSVFSKSTPPAPVVPSVPSSKSTPPAPVVPSVPSKSTPAAPVMPSSAAPTVSSSSSAVVASSSVYSSAKASASAPAVKVNGKKWAMTYTPYNSAGQCKTASEVDVDVAAIQGKGFTTIRLYATDCSGLINIGASARKHGMKLILGVFIKAAGIDDARPQIKEISAWGSAGNWDMVSMVVIGNEAIMNNYCSASALAAFITEAKSTWSAAGYSGPCTTTEPLNKLQDSAGALCSVIDVVAANIQPYFNAGISSSEAGTFVASQLALVAAACPGKTAYNLESGWPSAGSPNGKAVASPSDQAVAIADIVDKAGDHSVIFSYEDDSWKASGTFGVEQFFGCAKLF